MGPKPPRHVLIQNSCNFQCNTSADLIECIEGGTYSREEALVHASIGFDARFGLNLDSVLLPDGGDFVDDPGYPLWRQPCGKRSSLT